MWSSKNLKWEECFIKGCMSLMNNGEKKGWLFTKMYGISLNVKMGEYKNYIPEYKNRPNHHMNWCKNLLAS